MKEENPKAILIAGPTASGKSELALKLALRHAPSAVINADSMQVHEPLGVLTARPSPDEMKEIPHYLYGHHSPAEGDYSVALWLKQVEEILERLRDEGKTPVFCGGTGLYFERLTKGIDEIPPVDPLVREKWRTLALESPESLPEELNRRDRLEAERLKGADARRLARALEVIESTGKPMRHWREHSASVPLIDESEADCLLLSPPREALRERIESRFRKMVKNEAAFEEVQHLLSLRLPADSPVMKAIGVPEISAFLRGEIELEQAIQRAISSTRRYAKRQDTWFRNRFSERWKRIPVDERLENL